MRAFILMAAMPPTLGHADLIRFATKLAPAVTVLVVTRGDEEPYQNERVEALREHFAHAPEVAIQHYPVEGLSQEGNPYWAEVLRSEGFAPGDILVASEDWGIAIASLLGGLYYPYDTARSLRYTKATEIRKQGEGTWEWIIPEFQRMLQKKLVIFGAESVGKTTLTEALKKKYASTIGVFEYARPYLETVGPELTQGKMYSIWQGQKALQETVNELAPVKQLQILDTDLYSTLGYWEFWDKESVPTGLKHDAARLQGDLYVLLRSNIPFEENPLRYGGTQREQSDSYWKAVLEAYGVPYVELKAAQLDERIAELAPSIDRLLSTDMAYERLD